MKFPIGKLSSTLVSEIMKTSKFPLTCSLNNSNLLRIEFIFKWPNTNLFLYPYVCWAKKSRLVSGNQLGEFFLKLTRSHSRMCIRIYVFNFKKQTNKQKNKNTIKARQTEQEKRISPENRLKKINLRPPGWRFFLSPAFPETRVFSFLFELVQNILTFIDLNRIIKINFIKTWTAKCMSFKKFWPFLCSTHH